MYVDGNQRRRKICLEVLSLTVVVLHCVVVSGQARQAVDRGRRRRRRAIGETLVRRLSTCNCRMREEKKNDHHQLLEVH